MKNTMKKLTAGVSALAMAAALSATSVPAFAAEFESMESQEFVNSFEDERAHNVAQYCVDNCATLNEAREIMKTYMEGRALIDSESTTTPLTRSTKKTHAISGPYYSGSNLASTPHRAVILVMNTAATMEGSIKISWNHNKVKYLCDEKEPYKFFSNYSNMEFSLKTDQDTGDEFIKIEDRIKRTTDTAGDSASVCSFKIKAVSEATSESSVHSAFMIDTRGIYSTNGQDSDIEIHTYALGDYDHNGIVNSADSSYLLELLTGYDVTFTYGGSNSSEYNAVSGPVSVLTADANESGTIDISDVTWINQHI